MSTELDLDDVAATSPLAAAELADLRASAARLALERELHGIAAAMENLANERDALRAAQLHNRLVIAQHEEHLGRIQDELSESRSLLDEANADRDRLYKALEYVVRDLNTRANMKLRKEDRGVVDIGNGAWFQANDALEKHNAAPVPAQPAKIEGCMWAVTKGDRTICQPPRNVQPAAVPEAVAKASKLLRAHNEWRRGADNTDAYTATGLGNAIDTVCDKDAPTDTHVRCNGCGAHWKINTLSGCHECDMTLQDMKDAGVYEEYEENET